MTRSIFIIVTLFATVAPRAAHGIFMKPQMVPVERLLKNTQAHLERNPGDPAGTYTLGRIHYLAFVLGLESIPAFSNADGQIPSIAKEEMIGEPIARMRRGHAVELAEKEFKLPAGHIPEGEEQRRLYFLAVSKNEEALEKANWRPPAMSRETLLEHATQAARAFRRALELKPDEGLFHLGLASLFTQVADWNEDAEPAAALSAEFPGDLKTTALHEYFAAWKAAHPAEARATHLPLMGLSEFVSYEAGQTFLRLAGEHAGALTAEEKTALPRVREAIEKQEQLPMGPITPMIVPLRPAASIDELLAPERIVEFDLRGFGVAERWPWLKPDAGLLVWDPEDRRDIRSARQLFGSYTFQIFWESGFAALASLDDNADGELTGRELAGIAVWFDRDGDAVSSRDEVTPIAVLGVRALSTQATAREQIHPMNPAGVTHDDGRKTPSWDWIATPDISSAP